MKKSKKSKGTAAAKDLRVGKRSGEAVKGGRITNVRADAAGVPVGLGGVGQLQA